jgi:hypothetical protein
MLAPDGKWVSWMSTMNTLGGRNDLLVAEIP